MPFMLQGLLIILDLWYEQKYQDRSAYWRRNEC